MLNETERKAVDVALSYERDQGRFSSSTELGFQQQDWEATRMWWSPPDGLEARRPSADFVSYNENGSPDRVIEIKGKQRRAEDPVCSGIPILDRQWCTAQSYREHFWLYVVFGCNTPDPYLIVVQDPRRLPWHRLEGQLPFPGAKPGSPASGNRWHVSARDVLVAGIRIA